MGKTENGTVTRSEESITLVTAYRFPHHSSRSFTFVQDDALWFFSPWVRILRWRSEWRLAIRRHSALLADGSQLTANSSQLIADSFYLLTVSLTMTPYHPRLFWTGARIPCGKDGKRNSDTEWRIYYPDESLPISSLCQWIICYPNDMKKRGNKKEMPAAINAAGISFIVCIQ